MESVRDVACIGENVKERDNVEDLGVDGRKSKEISSSLGSVRF
jgi:hypothetical protein